MYEWVNEDGEKGWPKPNKPLHLTWGQTLTHFAYWTTVYYRFSLSKVTLNFWSSLRFFFTASGIFVLAYLEPVSKRHPRFCHIALLVLQLPFPPPLSVLLSLGKILPPVCCIASVNFFIKLPHTASTFPAFLSNPAHISKFFLLSIKFFSDFLLLTSRP